MRFDIDVSLAYRIIDTKVLLAVEAAQTAVQTVLHSSLEIDGAEITRLKAEDGIATWVWAHLPAGDMTLRYRAQVEISRSEPALEGLRADAPEDLPFGALTYMRPSRYCQSDMLEGFVAREFGGYEGGAKIAAIRDWVRAALTYRRGASNSATTALDTFDSREGVCRDYAHLVCALSRAAFIPARYAAVYGSEVTPPDFHAVAQVWLEGAWHFVDATGMCRASNLALIAVGRDACEVAFMETESHAQMLRQTVTVTQIG
ncbi:transglutaminase family protein [Albirhodobacter sp. R86504]|uniref:transglutaminase-like domain-containing protein n=1 Tax=Albirhodobacter sp. R86504 TaxID=3093848 RepID=UPI00366B5F36